MPPESARELEVRQWLAVGRRKVSQPGSLAEVGGLCGDGSGDQDGGGASGIGGSIYVRRWCRFEDAYQGVEIVAGEYGNLSKDEVIDILSKVENYIELQASETARLIDVLDEGVIQIT